MTRVWLAMSLNLSLFHELLYLNSQQKNRWNFCTQIPSQKCTRQHVSTDVSFHKLIKLFFVFHPLPPTFSIFSFSFCLVFVWFCAFFCSWPFHDILLFISHFTSLLLLLLLLFILSSAVSIEIIKISLDSSAPPTIIICFHFFSGRIFLIL